MKKQTAFILLQTLLFLSIIALLMLAQMQLLFLHYKALAMNSTRRHVFWELEAAARAWGSEVNRLPPACQINVNSADEVIEQVKKHQTCQKTFHGKSYFLAVEDLGSFPCLQITRNNLIYSSHHWRLTVEASQESVAVIQLRIAMSEVFGECKESTSRLIHSGIISWRYLN